MSFFFNVHYAALINDLQKMCAVVLFFFFPAVSYSKVKKLREELQEFN